MAFMPARKPFAPTRQFPPAATPLRALRWMAGVCILLAAATANADEVVLKNGIVLQGSALMTPGIDAATARQNNQGPVPNASYWMIDDGVRRYFVFRRQVREHSKFEELSRQVKYQLRHQRGPRLSGFGTVGGFNSIEPFDEFGRRRVSLTVKGKEVSFLQGIAELRPDYARVESLSHSWEYCVDTKTLPEEIIRAVMSQASDRDALSERKASIQFFLQAEMLPAAQSELQLLARDFPDEARWCEDVDRQIAEAKALRGLNEIQRRREAGQHALAYQIARLFPADRVRADVLRQAQGIVTEYEDALADRDRALLLLDERHARLPAEQAARLSSIRATLASELHFETIQRLRPFLLACEDDQLTAEEQLALAYSSWLLGGNNAVQKLDETIRLWDARFAVLEYLRTDRDPVRDQELLAELAGMEGVSVARVAAMIPLLPLPFETAPLPPGQLQEFTLPSGPEQPTVTYSLQLPPEYSPHHSYPLLVVLRGEGQDFPSAVRWWAGEDGQPGWAQRRGYIVIAPHYCDLQENSYRGADVQHEIVLRSIIHARQRFQIDSNRIFLTGHGSGGDACFDIGLSHPDWFAGVIPINGLAERYALYYSENAPQLSWYVINGERDRSAPAVNAKVLNRMMNKGQDVVYCEYKSRGYESYFEEQERLFDWMAVQRRAPLADFSKWEASSLRVCDSAFHWMKGHDFPARLFQPIVWEAPTQKITSKRFAGNMTTTGAIFVDHPGKKTTVWLSPELFDFNNRCQVKVNTRLVHNDFVKPSLEALLQQARERGDRERLFWARLDL